VSVSTLLLPPDGESHASLLPIIVNYVRSRSNNTFDICVRVRCGIAVIPSERALARINNARTMKFSLIRPIARKLMWTNGGSGCKLIGEIASAQETPDVSATVSATACRAAEKDELSARHVTRATTRQSRSRISIAFSDHRPFRLMPQLITVTIPTQRPRHSGVCSNVYLECTCCTTGTIIARRDNCTGREADISRAPRSPREKEESGTTTSPIGEISHREGCNSDTTLAG